MSLHAKFYSLLDIFPTEPECLAELLNFFVVNRLSFCRIHKPRMATCLLAAGRM